MKICLYCDTVNDDSAKVCSACGASKFKNKCNNCGTIFESSFCPTCGIKAGTQAKVCPQCGEKYFSPACPRCGHNGVVSKAQRQVDEEQQRVVVEHVTRVEERPKKKVTFGKVLLWIFFLPIMAVIAIWRSKLAVKWKIVLTAVVVAVMLLYSRSNKATETAGNASNIATSNSLSSITTIMPTATEKPDTTAVPAPEQKPAKDGFDEATNQVYQVNQLRFSIPAYYGTPRKTSTQDQMLFYTERDGKLALSVSCKPLALTQENYEREEKDEFEKGLLQGIEDATLIDKEDGIIVGFPGRTVYFTGYTSGLFLRYKACYSYDESSGALICFMFGQTDDTEYDYSLDFDSIVNSAVMVESQSEEPKKDASGVSTDLKVMLDEYEAFVDSYCEFMKKYNEASDVSSFSMEYISLFSKYSSWAQKMDSIKEEDLSRADLLYYEEVMLRCSNKMLKIAGK